MLRRIFHSLSARLLAVFLITALVYGVASRFVVELVFDRDYLRQIAGAHVSLHADYVLRDIGLPPDLARAQAIVDKIPVDIRITGPGMDWSSDPSFPEFNEVPYGASDLLGVGEEARENLESWVRTLELVEFARYQDHVFVKLTHDDYLIGFVSPKMSVSPGPNLTTPSVALVSILVLLGCYWAVTWLFLPIKEIREGTRRFGGGELDYRIPTDRKDDLGQLAGDVNQLADDVQGMLDAKQQLLLAISHELRSPVTRMRLAVEAVDAESVRESLLEDLAEMERLTADLLESERLNDRHSKLRLETVDVGALVHELIETEFPTQSARIQLVSPPEPVEWVLDPIRIRLLVKNLVENALRHSPEEGEPVQVTVIATDRLSIVVKDHGEGIAEEHLEKVTEAFYRGDPARCRDTGGFGLGLYLCRLIAEAHEGLFHIISEPGDGTIVSLVLPPRPAPAQA